MQIRNKILLFSTIILIIYIAMIIFVILPIRNNILNAKSNINDKKVMLEITKRKSENLSALDKDYKEMNNKNKNLDNMSINQESQLTLFKDIENLAQSNNVELNFNLETADTKKTQGEVKLNINLEGDFVDIIKYINGLEVLDYYINIFSISFNSSNVGANIITTIQAKTYMK